MDSKSQEQLSQHLRMIADAIEQGRASWVWVTIQFNAGARLTIASKNAPNRPQGIKA